MKFIIPLLTVVMVVSITLAGCATAPAPEVLEEPPTPYTWQNTVDAVSMLTWDLRTPDYLKQEDAVKTGEEFDVNEYFSVLTHLSMQPGYVLDYVYYYGGIGGEPVIYAREVDQTPYLTYSEYVNVEGKMSFGESLARAMERIQVDGTAEGFFEFVVLRTMGNQFYQWWHALYNDATVVCDDTGSERVLMQSGMPLSYDDELKVRSLDFQPVVTFENNTVVVKVVIFTRWGGFIQKSYTISQDFPHRILQVESETLVELDIDIQF